MNQTERREYLIGRLLNERPEYRGAEIPADEMEQRQLRRDCGRIMREQGHEEPTGQAKNTPGYNLPAKYVLHTVGPIVDGELTREHEELLVSCYRSCLALAAEKGLQSVAFCCISTGVFRFPKQRAAEIAVRTVREYMKQESTVKKVIFNVFNEKDEQIYRELLGQGEFQRS